MWRFVAFIYGSIASFAARCTTAKRTAACARFFSVYRTNKWDTKHRFAPCKYRSCYGGFCGCVAVCFVFDGGYHWHFVGARNEPERTLFRGRADASVRNSSAACCMNASVAMQCRRRVFRWLGGALCLKGTDHTDASLVTVLRLFLILTTTFSCSRLISRGPVGIHLPGCTYYSGRQAKSPELACRP